VKGGGQSNRDNDEIFEAHELAEIAERDPERLEKVYFNEHPPVRGEIFEIRNVISAVVVRMYGRGENYSGTHLEWHLSNRDDAEDITEGNRVTLKGTYQGFRTGTSPTGEEITWIRFTRAVLEK